MCNERCLKSATPGPQVATGTPGAPVPTTDGSQPAPSAAQCPDCARLLEELNRLDYLIWLWNDSLSEMRATRSRLRSERDRLMQGREGLEAAQHDASIRVSDAEYRLRVEQLNTEQGKVDGELEGLGDEIDNAQDTLKQLRKERDEWWPKWNGCNRRCSPKRTQWFTKPMFWIPIGGAIAGVAAAGGGGTTTPAPAVTVAPPTPNVTTTTNPTPAPAAPPTSRRPAETLNVTGCTCVENAAALDGTLQLCQRLHLIRTQGSGTAITLSGDPPLPTFQGTFNEATGEFELRTTTTLGTSSSAVVIAGNVETSGNLHNVRVSFSGLAGRQTLYTLTLAP